MALQAAGATAVVLDDGLSHRRLHRDVDIVVVDGRFPKGRGLIPLGERREMSIVPSRVHGVIVQRGLPGDIEVDKVPVAAANRLPGVWHKGDRAMPAPEGPVAAFAGVGRPADVLASLAFPVARFRGLQDHQQVDSRLAKELLDWAGDLPLVCTAKDWVRLPKSLQGRVWWRDENVTVDGAPESWFPTVNAT